MRPCDLPGTVQIHASRFCNLRCVHCYSWSGPEERTGLAPSLLVDAVGEAWAEGYSRVSFSGGEPLLYPGLERVLGAAKRLGMATSLTTNGIPLTPRKLAGLAGLVDLIAVSLDGRPAAHDRMRGPRAFERMRARLAGLRDSGIPFGFIFTLTRANLEDLAWVAGFAIDEGAKLLQIHPLEEVGRAAEEQAGERPSDLIANAAYLAYMRLQERVAGRIALQLDLAHRGLIQEEPWRVYADKAPGMVAGVKLAALLDTVVIEADGLVVPLQYGFPRAHALGSLQEAGLAALAERWRGAGYAGFRAHCREVFERSLVDAHALPAFNWFEALGA